MKYIKLSIITLAVVAMMTACGSKDTSNTAGQAPEKTAPVVSVITAQAEELKYINFLTSATNWQTLILPLYHKTSKRR